MKKLMIFLAGLLCLATLAFLGCKKELSDPSLTSNAGKKTDITKPTISCGDATQATISIVVCAPAGGTGLPAGFSLQWMTAADYAANGNQWYSSDDARLCKASFSGNANLSRYNLAAGNCVTVKVGEFLFDEGASTNCGDALLCGTEYVFRAFGHATSTLNRSEFTANLSCSTDDCVTGEGCTYTQGYWKTHNPTVCVADPTSPLCIQWPVDNLTLGTVNYDIPQLLSIFNKPAAGNGLIALAHQLIAAKLNIANGADNTNIQASIDAADALIGGLVVPPVGAGYLAPAQTSTLINELAGFNEGDNGVPHCK